MKGLDKKFMKLAIKEALKAIDMNDQPFGAVITKDNSIITKAYCTTRKEFDLTKHAEMNAIRKACKKLNTFNLSDCTIYSTAEPCLMCFGAIKWVKISKLVFGVYNKDTKSLGFSEPCLNKEDFKKYGKNIIIKKGILKKEIMKIFEQWQKLKDRLVY